MFNISTYLKRSRDAYDDEYLYKQRVVDAVNAVVGLSLNPRDISRDNGVVYIQGLSGVARSEVTLRKNDILEKLRSYEGDTVITDLR